jgi:hypothetical protein
MLLQFGNERGEALNQYREFVRAGLKEESPWKEVKGQLFLGGDSFIEKFKRLIKGKEALKEIPKVQRYVTRPTLEKIFKNKRKDKKLKDKVIHEAHIRYGYTLREIAEYLGVHYATISRTVSRIEGEIAK